MSRKPTKLFGGLYSDMPESDWKDPQHIASRDSVEKSDSSHTEWPPRERRGSRIPKNPSPESSTGKHKTLRRSKSPVEKRDRSRSRSQSTKSSRNYRHHSSRKRSRSRSRSSSRGRRHHSSPHRSESSSSSSRSSSTSTVTSRSHSVRSPDCSVSTSVYGPPHEYCEDGDENDEDDEMEVPRQKMEFYCEVCGITATTFDALQVHFAGAKHNKNLRKVGYGNTFKSMHEVRDPQLSNKILRCLLCDVILTEAEVSIHVGCTTHVKALERAEERFKEMDPDKWFVEATKLSIKAPKNGYTCTLCNITLPNFEGFQAHMQGKRHMKAVKISSATPSVENSNVSQVWCNICNIFCTNQESLDIHLKGKKHQKTLKNKGFIQEENGSKSSSNTLPTVVANPFMETASQAVQKVRCTLCDIVLSSNTETQAHLSTTEHYMALRRAAPGKKQKDMFVPAL